MEKVSLKKQLPENPSDDTKDLTETVFSSNSSQEDSRIIYTNENCVLCRDTKDAFRLKMILGLISGIKEIIDYNTQNT